MSQLRVLVSGASVAGPALAYWLVRAGCNVTIVERAPYLRTAGQGIDVRDEGREVIRRMGIFNTMRERSSKEEGLHIVDKNNGILASFGVDLESGKGDSPTSDMEVLRGEVAKILYEITEKDVSYIFGDMVESFNETDKEINVKFANGTPTQSFDLLVAADGIGSKIRTMAFGADSVNLRSLNSYVSYFSIPPGKTDSMWARVHWLPGGRNMAVRPDNIGLSRVFLTQVCYDPNDPRLAKFAKAAKEGVEAQKSLVQKIFQDGDWEMARFLEGMQKSDDFYLQHVAQIRLKRWSTGRVTVVGDAGYAPSPFTGMGTSIAFMGAYILAGEISKHPGDLSAALKSYEAIFRPYVESVQRLPPGIPWAVNPQSALGVRVLENFLWGIGLIQKTPFPKLFWKFLEYIPGNPFGNDPFKLPEYEAFKV